MNIGILTFHQAHNYGAVLQCYALQETLRALGHEVCIINYNKKFIKKVYKIFDIRLFFQYMLHHPRVALRYLWGVKKRIIRKKNFDSFIKKHLLLSEECDFSHIPYNLDLYIIGSDQLWNSSLTGGCDKVYWGEFLHKPSSSLITYAISTSLSNLACISETFVKQHIKEFKSISVREKTLSLYLTKKFISRDYVTCLDPTLIADKKIWNTVCSYRFKHEKYVLIYQTRGYNNNPKLLRQKAEYLAKKENLKVIDLSTVYFPPEDFIGLFRYATCVITTSFHAVAFSLIFNKPFYAIALNDGHDSRYVDLLKSIGLESSIVKPDFIPQATEVDYTQVNNKLSKLKSISIDYLKSNLGEYQK